MRRGYDSQIYHRNVWLLFNRRVTTLKNEDGLLSPNHQLSAFSSARRVAQMASGSSGTGLTRRL